MPLVLLSAFLVFNVSIASAQKIVSSGAQSAGFRILADKTAKAKGVVSTVPVISYQQNIQMLSSVDDRPSLQVFGDGRVLVHYPVYMKKAGDYEMQLSDAELTDLIQSLSSNGVMDFDENRVKSNVQAYDSTMRKQGELYHVSDAVVTVIDVRLDEYQKNNTAVKITNFHKQFKWENIEHDAVRYEHDSDISNVYKSITHLQDMMKDARLVRKEP